MLRTEALFQGALFLVRAAGVLMILTGIVALLCKRWGMLSAMAKALALLLTCLLLFFLMPQEVSLPFPDHIGPCREGENLVCMTGTTEIRLPHLRTDIPFPVLASIAMLEWLAVVVAYGHRDSLREANLRGADLSGVELGMSEEEGTS